MKHEKTTQKPPQKRKSSKTAANPAASTVCAALLQNDTDISPDFAESHLSQTQQPCGLPPSLHRDPSLPTEASKMFPRKECKDK